MDGNKELLGFKVLVGVMGVFLKIMSQLLAGFATCHIGFSIDSNGPYICSVKQSYIYSHAALVQKQLD